MDFLIVKDPKDSTGADVDSFLASKGYGGLKRLDKAEKLNLPKNILSGKTETQSFFVNLKPS